jgi:hypothetical protein
MLAHFEDVLPFQTAWREKNAASGVGNAALLKKPRSRAS